MRIRLDDGSLVETKLHPYMYANVTRHDRVVVYVRHRGRKKRIRDWSSVEAFMAEYKACLAGSDTPPVKAAAPDTIRRLVERYYASGQFHMLEGSTRQVRRRMLDAFCEKHGHKPFKMMETRHIATLRDEKVTAGSPEAGNNLVKVLKALFSWATDPEIMLAEHNPAKGVKRINTGSTGHHPWTVDEVRHYEERHPVGSKARLAMTLMLYTGTRASDAIRLGPQMERQGRLHFTEFKNRNSAPKTRAIPILPELREIIDATPSGHLSYLVTEHGKPYSTAKSFGNWFKRQCVMAGLPHCTAHGLRKAGATIAADNGTPNHALMAIFGWTTLKQAEVYTREADQKRLADKYMSSLVPERIEHESDPPSEAVSARWVNESEKS